MSEREEGRSSRLFSGEKLTVERNVLYCHRLWPKRMGRRKIVTPAHRGNGDCQTYNMTLGSGEIFTKSRMPWGHNMSAPSNVCYDKPVPIVIMCTCDCDMLRRPLWHGMLQISVQDLQLLVQII